MESPEEVNAEDIEVNGEETVDGSEEASDDESQTTLF